jgi:hypothetical protein
METTIVNLTKPLKRGDQEIANITLHKPYSGQLRGVSLRACLDIETDAVCTVIPRISEPKITPQEIASQAIDPSDLLKLGAALAGFFLPPSVIEEAAKNFESQTE